MIWLWFFFSHLHSDHLEPLQTTFLGPGIALPKVLQLNSLVYTVSVTGLQQDNEVIITKYIDDTQLYITIPGRVTSLKQISGWVDLILVGDGYNLSRSTLVLICSTSTLILWLVIARLDQDILQQRLTSITVVQIIVMCSTWDCL